MQLASIFQYATLAVILLTALAFAIGYKVGQRQGKRIGVAFGAAYFFANALAFAATRSLANKIGPIVQWEVLGLIAAIFFGYLLGYSVAQRRKPEESQQSALLAGVAALVMLIALGVVISLNQKVIETAQQLGLDKTVKYEPTKNKACPENLTSLYLAFTMYAQDWNGLPPAEKWLENEELTSKVRQNEWLHCPEVSNRADDKFGYAYNTAVAGRKLNGKPLKEMPEAATTPLLYDSTNLTKSASDAFASLPKPGRHGGRNNILYCDGHVEAK